LPAPPTLRTHSREQVKRLYNPDVHSTVAKTFHKTCAGWKSGSYRSRTPKALRAGIATSLANGTLALYHEGGTGFLTTQAHGWEGGLMTMVLLLISLAAEVQSTEPLPFSSYFDSPSPQELYVLSYPPTMSSAKMSEIALKGGKKDHIGCGLIGYGYRAYLSMANRLIVYTDQRDEILWSEVIKFWCKELAFVEATAVDTEEALVVVRVRGGSPEITCLFDLKTGGRKYQVGEEPPLLVADEEPPIGPGKEIELQEFTTGEDSGYTEKTVERIETLEEWKAFWHGHKPDEDMPQIDFTQTTVLAYAVGEAMQTLGYRFETAMETDNEITLYLQPRRYQITIPLRRNVQGQLVEDPDGYNQYLHTPYFIAVLPKTSKEIAVLFDVAALIGQPAVYRETVRLK
jgi:hypothetical protein